ncbi:hypothetical protein [Clostridium perfringens]|uniref:hypothetical protein n=1 Tax=Clostridium perfringens TaxID=1502 RepID=UPI0028CECE79|nr:hypothetical protein [Clostridium perfringens]MDT7917828.1 hypothetical protein [Clostridium perfringens]MDT7937420.1 hypothetical protein [Clostridium perfringens]MDT7940641.1 hypothetical protein [Clostridium perfringens]MDT7966559.1 hypothetical protein [Clostridium perfringens]MDT7991248.1 hypothetical protein [Clostridium perfringens]
MVELKNQVTSITSTPKVTSEINETTNLNGVVNIEVNGIKKQVMSMSCILTENSVANIQTFVTDMDLFQSNSQEVVKEVQKFRDKATQVGRGLNCFVF